MIQVVYKVWRPTEVAVISFGVGSYQKRNKQGQVKVPGKWDTLTEHFETADEAHEFAADARNDGHRIVAIREISESLA